MVPRLRAYKFFYKINGPNMTSGILQVVRLYCTFAEKGGCYLKYFRGGVEESEGVLPVDDVFPNV